MKYIIKPFREILNFSGTSTRKEFFTYFSFAVLCGLLIGFFGGRMNLSPDQIIFLSLLMHVPTIPLGIRRLNEAGFNKWLFLVPYVNLILAFFPPKKKAIP